MKILKEFKTAYMIISKKEMTDFQVTDAGNAWVTSLGIEQAGVLRPSSARLAYPCMDWSERQPHLAGTLATQLLKQFIVNGWLLSSDKSRALTITARGKKDLLTLIG